ncbi:sn1-specific diacylglycerol lipase [Marchantia polymorpha subsp. ruderalis]|uniref:Fungal lipase-type domain-containing protein n=2 Tax=Marchantia polymorpha TaxID=3197 RepID=A0A176WHD8_MARPO|nr:hypothetical protein AXG93_2190s1240 [Marchantia polymorpha subsp. ruderalis]PTQ40266.1 hypothetical protein MARPO_0041s0124 [Marchantia polymorpha]BBN09278.1 hypothetical protein Mp_4g18430 [Marchantia polymorpha subsp. ruderalis]|eukprot:PTQ40266.1 hypothetical protein MARPO_0041s0124 [Marchantia polymorpha]
MLSAAGEALRGVLKKDECDGDSSDDDKGEKPTMSAEHWAHVSHPGYEKPQFHRHSGSDAADKVPAAVQTSLAAVAASIIYSATGMSRWGLAELTLGLYKVYCRHTHEKVIDTISGYQVTSIREMQDISHYLKWAKAAYREKTELLTADLEVDEKDIIKHETTSAFGQPAYFVALNHAKKAVVLSIRGTFSAIDVLTDLKPHSENFGDGYAHSGMLHSAQWLKENTLEMLQEHMKEKGYRLVVTGHSLGAGAASLLAMLLRKTDEKGLTALGIRPELITCWGFGCPPCVDQTTAQQTKYIKNIVHQDDIVARISPAGLEDLRSEILETEWSHALEDGSTRRKIVELAQSSAAALEKLEPALNLERGQLYSKVKDTGWSALMSVGNGFAQSWTKAVEGAYGPRYGQAATIISKGAEIAAKQINVATKHVTTTVNGAIDQQMKLIDPERKDATVTASSMAAKAAVVTEKEEKALLLKNRLVVPGTLYHVIRRPLKGDEQPPPDEVPDKEKCATDTAYRWLVIRGDDPASRFKRIVISTTMISDHLCLNLQNSLANAMKWHLHVIQK